MIRSILILQNALRNYNILGPKVFQDAYLRSVITTPPVSVDNIHDEEVLREAKDFWERLAGAWKIIKDRVNDGETIALISQATQFLIEKAPHAARLLGMMSEN